MGSQVSARLLRTYAPHQLQTRALTALAIISLIAISLTLTGLITLPLLMVCLIDIWRPKASSTPTRPPWPCPNKVNGWA